MGDQHRYNAYMSSKPLTDVYIKYNNLHEFVKQNRPVVMCTNEEIGCEITVFSLFSNYRPRYSPCINDRSPLYTMGLHINFDIRSVWVPVLGSGLTSEPLNL